MPLSKKILKICQGARGVLLDKWVNIVVLVPLYIQIPATLRETEMPFWIIVHWRMSHAESSLLLSLSRFCARKRKPSGTMRNSKVEPNQFHVAIFACTQVHAGVLHNKISAAALARISGAFITFAALAHDTSSYSKARYNRMPLHSAFTYNTVRNKNSVVPLGRYTYYMYSGLVFWRPALQSLATGYTYM